ncbi:hypothetical protein Q1695_000780 [Nippostrongylus brasiliensis]|nr:hypothetical protein Q1695_000780 [Nippostrongylus brasiliensis]
MDTRTCRICSDRSDGAHFGIDACRACAAFFRRSIVMRKKYVCRKGTNSCDINKSLRCICRKCRLQKCMAVGMLPEGVQNKRDPIIPRIVDKEDAKPSTSAAAMSSSENETVHRSPWSAFQSVNQPQPVLQPPLYNVHGSGQPESPHTLMKIARNYRQLCAVRKSTEMAMNGASIRSMFDISSRGSFQELVLGTAQKTSMILRAQLPSLADFVNTTFDEFALLNKEDKWTVFQSFILMLWTVDTIYRTYRLVPPEQYETMNIITETTFMSASEMIHFFDDAPASKLSRQDLTKMMIECLKDKHRVNTLNTMHKLEINENEFAALIALALWNPTIRGSNDAIEKVAAEARAKIFHQLHILYRIDGKEDYSIRFGELLMLNGSLQVGCCKFREDIELFNLFDLFQDDTFLYDITRH